MIDTQIESLPLDSIDLSDQTYRISSEPDQEWIDTLAESIDRLGLLYPPLAIETKFHRQIVSGFRRIKACNRLGHEKINCRLLVLETPPRRAAQLSVAENAWQRPLNLIEKARAFALLEKYYNESERTADVAKPLGLVENPTMIDKLIHLSRLPVTIQQAVESGTVGLAMALSLGTLGTEDGRKVLGLFETFHFGLNRQRELLGLIREIAKRESITIGQVLEANEITTILNGTDQDRPGRAAALHRYLKKRRYPALIKAEADFRKLERELTFGTKIKMNPPPYFEGQTYQLILSFDSLEELSGHQEQLKKMEQHPLLKRFLEN